MSWFWIWGSGSEIGLLAVRTTKSALKPSCSMAIIFWMKQVRGLMLHWSLCNPLIVQNNNPLSPLLSQTPPQPPWPPSLIFFCLPSGLDRSLYLWITWQDTFAWHIKSVSYGTWCLLDAVRWQEDTSLMEDYHKHSGGCCGRGVLERCKRRVPSSSRVHAKLAALWY